MSRPYKCDHCGKEERPERAEMGMWGAMDGWWRVTRMPEGGQFEEQHYCSRACVIDALVAEAARLSKSGRVV